MKGRLLSIEEEAPKGEGKFASERRNWDSTALQKKEEAFAYDPRKRIFLLLQKRGVSDDISFFVSKKHDRPSSSVLLSNRHGRTIGEVRKEERWSLPQNLIYLFL